MKEKTLLARKNKNKKNKNQIKQTMIIICIEGSHASGKSTLCKQFEASNYLTLDEAFFTMPGESAERQSEPV